MEQQILIPEDTKERLKQVWENIKEVLVKFMGRVKEVFYNFFKTLKVKDKEYVRLLNIANRVKSKRLKKKYKNKIIRYIESNYLDYK